MTNLSNLADLNPLLTKELRGRMRGWRAIAILTGYLFLLAGVTWLAYTLITATASGTDLTGAQLGKFLLGTIVVFQMFFVALLSPAFTAGIITGEREKQTFDLLMTTLLRPRSIILGKMGAALAWLVLLVLAVVPLSSLSFLLGGVAPEELILALVVLLAATFFYGAIGLFWSSVMRSTIAAVVLSLLTIGVLLMLFPVLYYMIFAFLSFSNRGTTPGFLGSPVFLYINELILSTHPFYAMGRSEAYLLDGKSLFFVQTTLGGQSVTMIHPWLFFTLLALALGTLLIGLAIRNLPPVRRHAHAAYAPQMPEMPDSLASPEPTEAPNALPFPPGAGPGPGPYPPAMPPPRPVPPEAAARLAPDPAPAASSAPEATPPVTRNEE